MQIRQQNVRMKCIAYPLTSHFSFSKPLWMDWPIELSMSSTYRITCGENNSRRWLWNRPFTRFSTRKKNQKKSGARVTGHENLHSRWGSVWLSNSGVSNRKKSRDGWRQLTVQSKIVVESLKEGKRVPGVRRLFRQYLVHINCKQAPENLRMLYQQIREPSEGLKTPLIFDFCCVTRTSKHYTDYRLERGDKTSSCWNFIHAAIFRRNYVPQSLTRAFSAYC